MSEDRFWSKVDRSGECWLWTASVDRQGYGWYWDGAKVIRAHRYIYAQEVGPIPEGLTLDHLCRVPGCVRPEHMEVVSLKENLRRGVGWAGSNAQKTHCKHGHEFTPENTRISRAGHRYCRTCKRELDRARRWGEAIPCVNCGAPRLVEKQRVGTGLCRQCWNVRGQLGEAAWRLRSE